MCRVALPARDRDGLVRRPREHAGVAVERGHDLHPRAHLRQHRLDHLAIALHPRLAVAIEGLQAAHVLVHAGDPLLDDAVGRGHEHDVGLFDVAAGERGDVGAERDADADADQAAAARRGNGFQWIAPSSGCVRRV